VFDPPTGIEAALDDLESLLASPSLTLLGEGASHRVAMRQVLLSSRAAGNLVHDAHIAALLIENGVREFWTEDRDFARFPGLRVVHPFV
jgi:predicted nucleic acid-binding protein